MDALKNFQKYLKYSTDSYMVESPEIIENAQQINSSKHEQIQKKTKDSDCSVLIINFCV